MNVSLTPELETFVLTKVKSGRYNSASEVVREALRLLENHEKTRLSELKEFRAEIDRRLASLDRGEGIDGEEVFANLKKKSAMRRARSK
jgi:antitoxin ParD1/3/4